MATNTALREMRDCLVALERACAGHPKPVIPRQMRVRGRCFLALPPSLVFLAAYAVALGWMPRSLQGLFLGENQLRTPLGFHPERVREVWTFLNAPFTADALPEAVQGPLLVAVSIAFGECVPAEAGAALREMTSGTNRILDPACRRSGFWARDPRCLTAAVAYATQVICDRVEWNATPCTMPSDPWVLCAQQKRWALHQLWNLFWTWPVYSTPVRDGDRPLVGLVLELMLAYRGHDSSWVRNLSLAEAVAEWEPSVSDVTTHAPELLYESEFWCYFLERGETPPSARIARLRNTAMAQGHVRLLSLLNDHGFLSAAQARASLQTVTFYGEECRRRSQLWAFAVSDEVSMRLFAFESCVDARDHHFPD